MLSQTFKNEEIGFLKKFFFWLFFGIFFFWGGAKNLLKKIFSKNEKISMLRLMLRLIFHFRFFDFFWFFNILRLLEKSKKKPKKKFLTP